MTTTTSTTSKHTSSKRLLSQAVSRFMPKISLQQRTVPVSALEERLSERNDVKSQLAGLQSERGRLKENINRQYTQLRQAREKAEGYKAAVARENSPDGPSYSHQSLKAAEQEISRLQKSIEEGDLRLNELDSQAATLQQRIEALSTGSSEQDVKAYLQALNKAREELKRLDELIQSTQATSHFDDSHDETLEALQSAREDVLADIATGDAKPELLHQLDAQIEEMLSDSDGSQVDAITQERNKHQTLAGLERRRSAIQARYEQLKAQSAEVTEQLVIARVEALSEDYLKHAQALQQSYQQIQGMVGLLTSAVPDTKVRLLPVQWASAMIPALPLRSFESVQQHDADNGVLFSGRLASSPAERQAVTNEQLEQLKAMGISELFTQ
ncbi:hypothetical protein [Halomonas sp.]|uniref:hypothetical protein n=1 Tax=Halomonas sp. TaxID=1486246 RepID=UPI003F914226